MNSIIILLPTIISFLSMGLIFYFMIYKPTKKRNKQYEKMINTLNVGDEIVTYDGVIGKVKEIKTLHNTIEVIIIKSSINQLCYRKNKIAHVIKKGE